MLLRSEREQAVRSWAVEAGGGLFTENIIQQLEIMRNRESLQSVEINFNHRKLVRIWKIVEILLGGDC